MAAPPSLLLSPERIGDRPFALGVIADIYHGRLDGATVALKSLRGLQPNAQAKRALKEGLQRDARTWRRLDHRNIVPFLGLSTSIGPIMTLVTPYYPNGSVMTYMKKCPKAPVSTLLTGIADGVAYLHSRTPPVVHGDLRASNVLVDNSGTARLTDYGLAQLTATSDFTTANIAGPCRWQAPELFTDESDTLPFTPQSDVYSFGMLVLEVLTQSIPFKEVRHDTTVILAVVKGAQPRKPSHADIAHANANKDPSTGTCTNVSPSSIALLDKIWELLVRCWAMEPSGRPEMREVCAELSLIVG